MNDADDRLVAATLPDMPAVVGVPGARAANHGIADVASIATACAATPAGQGTDGLLTSLGRMLPDLEFRPVLTRGGWYRPGGVVDIEQRRVADSLRQWAEQQAVDGDLQPLLDACLRTRLFSTRLVGKTHYLTAATGSQAAEFVQLEVEELQEVLDRYLSDPEWLPDSLEEFIDPLDNPQLEPEPVGRARLVFRRIVAVPDLLMEPGGTSAQNVRRFLQDWDQGSAAQSGHCCDHWVLAIRDSVDSDGDAQRSVHLVPAHTSEPIAVPPGASGAELANTIQDFDRGAGYPMAWYFHMVAYAGVPDAVGRQVAIDHEQGFSYLPARDLALLRSWTALPYRA